eukprot:gene4432-8833_t
MLPGLLLYNICFISTIVNAWEWKLFPSSSTVCLECDTNKLCSSYIGDIPASYSFKFDNSCIIFDPKAPLITKEQILTKLGSNAVLSFVGDSNARNLYRAVLDFFGHDNWFTNLKTKAATWANKDIRRTVEQVYLCPLPFEQSSNITISFTWNKFLIAQQYLTNRPWTNCFGRCNSSNNINTCDGSPIEGLNDRWQCGSNLDSNDTNMSSPKQRRQQPVASAKEKYCWKNSHNGGIDILISPLHLRMASCTRKFCYGHESNYKLYDNALSMIRNHSLSSGVAHELFEGWIDAFELTDGDGRGAPWSMGDGVHYPPVVYRALAELLFRKILELA